VVLEEVSEDLLEVFEDVLDVSLTISLPEFSSWDDILR